MFDVAVVGAGLFGSVIATALRKRRAKVCTIDRKEATAGSKPAACLMRPSWFSSLGKEIYDPALEILDECYGVIDLEFDTPAFPVTVHWCNPAKILLPPDLEASVRSVKRSSSGWLLQGEGVNIEAVAVVVAAGIWTELLVPGASRLTGQAGMACLWETEDIERPFVRGWAPYKQITAFNRGDGLWVGDSNAVLMNRWSEQVAAATQKRCSEAVSLRKMPKRLFGIRPYSKMKPCCLEELRPNLWVATGGAKNGTLAAGWCASELVKKC